MCIASTCCCCCLWLSIRLCWWMATEFVRTIPVLPIRYIIYSPPNTPSYTCSTTPYALTLNTSILLGLEFGGKIWKSGDLPHIQRLQHGGCTDDLPMEAKFRVFFVPATCTWSCTAVVCPSPGVYPGQGKAHNMYIKVIYYILCNDCETESWLKQKIILEGFKSYANRTVVDGFDTQFNAITGNFKLCRNLVLTSIHRAQWERKI